jgi:hypothetical protein
MEVRGADHIPAVVVHQGHLYANTRYGMMYVFLELYDLNSAFPEIIPSVTRHPNAYVERNFLVESSPHGELMQVELLRPVTAAGGEGFMVRVLDECGETWDCGRIRNTSATPPCSWPRRAPWPRPPGCVPRTPSLIFL